MASWKVSYVGIFFGVAIGIGYFTGSWLDDRFHAQPWFSVAGMILGVAAAFRELLRVARQYQREQKD